MKSLVARFAAIILAMIWTLVIIALYQRSLRHPTHYRTMAMDALVNNPESAPSSRSSIPVKKSKILCWVLTQPKNHKNVMAVRNTWGSRCDKTLYFSSEANDTLSILKLDVPEGRKHLPKKTAKAFRYCHDHYLEEFDWFLKADDDTFIVVENLRKFVSNFSSSEPIYFGHNFMRYFKQGYMSGGAGYVLSREALKRFVTIGLAAEGSPCKVHDVGNEDVLVGSCLERLKVKAVDTVDDKQRERFLPLDPVHYLLKMWPNWLLDFSKFRPKKGKECCAEYIISLHYVSPSKMYLYDYLIYGTKLASEFTV
ncbi:hypothetical protein LOTGIDRAFT_191447 [Lottia gigantea]|uniref:Glycoprotein-N-acetylgalactosamine 3-beta-galactosyltransferase 1 n=1 Tax=Lottia gigantea TaxID=225164 RepID=V4ACE0_LOTGI|nr:hypothetical protein LOTGIDRAFT_191447 [Lottia gigantea]ESO90966.1 hypothetical protein LOTGIDRAFT_191447 [Lottia gigantea]